MQSRDSQRIQDMRSRVQGERMKVIAFGGSLGSSELKSLLKDAVDLLDDVECLFLDEDILREPRSEVALAKWLDNAEAVLGRAVQRREYVEALVEKFGANARIVG